MRRGLGRRLAGGALAGVLAGAALAAAPEALAPSGPAPAAAATSLRQVHRLVSPYGQFHQQTEAWSSPAVGDITGDGRPEIVVGASDGYVYAFGRGGGRVLSHDTGDGAITASPTLVDLDRDGTLDVLVGTLAHRVVAVTGTGRVVFDQRPPCRSTACGFFATPTVGDLDGDGDNEVVATSWDTYVYAWNRDGSVVPGFPVWVYDTVFSSPALADLDRDGRLEIVFGGDMDAYPGQPYPTGGLVWALRHDGRRQPGFPRSLPGQTIWSSPAVADIDLDGRLDIVVGTGLNFPDPAGRRVHGLDWQGRDLPGWPRDTPGKVMASPAVGDLRGDARLEVAFLSEGGTVSVLDSGGDRKWRVCNTSGRTCPEGYPVHGSVSIADVDGDGDQEVVSTAEQVLRVLDGDDGAVEGETVVDGQAFPVAGAPTIAEVEGSTWIVQHVTLNTNPDNGRGVGDASGVFVHTTDRPRGRADWPQFRRDRLRTGLLDDRAGPVTSIDPLPSGSGSTRVPVTVSATDPSGIDRFSVEVREGAGPWVRWVDGRPAPASGPATFTQGLHGRPGSTWAVRARARDRVGNHGPWAERSTSIAAGAVRSSPAAAAYAGSTSGALVAASSPPVPGASFGRAGRDVALRSSGGGGYLLAGDGRIAAFGGAPGRTPSRTWPGQDVARGIAVHADGSGYVVTDVGKLRPFGGAVAVGSPAFAGDQARDVVLTPASTATAPAGYVLDARGVVHAFGAAPAVAASRTWPGQDVARALTLEPGLGGGAPGGQVVDRSGGLHRFGSAGAATGGPLWPGQDRARGVAASGPGRGYVLGAKGDVVPYGGAPALEPSPKLQKDAARGLAVLP